MSFEEALAELEQHRAAARSAASSNSRRDQRLRARHGAEARTASASCARRRRRVEKHHARPRRASAAPSPPSSSECAVTRLSKLRAAGARRADAVERELDRLLPPAATGRRRGCTRRCAMPCWAAASGCGRSWCCASAELFGVRRGARAAGRRRGRDGARLFAGPRRPAGDGRRRPAPRPADGAIAQFDEATAILAGDALLTLAFEVLADPRHACRPGGALRAGARRWRGRPARAAWSAAR